MSRYRHEYKYLLTPPQEGILRLKASAVMRRDPHVRPDGSYLVRSAYLDDADSSCLSENLAGTDPRSKFRVRYYNDDAGRLLLEKKSKRRGMCLKESCPLSPAEYDLLLRGEVPRLREDMGSEKQALLTEIRLRGLKPVVVVTYERIPFIYSGGNVRVTFDRKLTSSPDVARFLTGDYRQRPVFPSGQSLLEVKWDEVFPRHLKEILLTDSLLWTAFSKYYLCRRVHM